MEPHLTTMGCHLPCGITHMGYLPPDTSEHTPPKLQPDRLVLDLPTPEGWKAELHRLLMRTNIRQLEESEVWAVSGGTGQG